MDRTHLVHHDDIEQFWGPTKVGLGLCERAFCHIHTRRQKPAGIRDHLVVLPTTKVVVTRVSHIYATQESMRRLGMVDVAEDHRDSTGTQCERRKMIAKILLRRRRLTEQADRILDRRAAGLADNNHRVADLSALDHHPGYFHRIQKREAGITDVKIQAIRTQPEISVNRARDRGLNVILRDGCADQKPNLILIDPSGLQDGFCCGGRNITWSQVFIKESPRNDTSELSQKPLSMSQALQSLRESCFQELRLHADRSIDVLKPLDADILKSHLGPLRRGKHLLQLLEQAEVLVLLEWLIQDVKLLFHQPDTPKAEHTLVAIIRHDEVGRASAIRRFDAIG